jgi:hypothetical protein
VLLLYLILLLDIHPDGALFIRQRFCSIATIFQILVCAAQQSNQVYSINLKFLCLHAKKKFNRGVYVYV